ncbi:hypothetical protein Ahia01_000560000 [Argonauta hians]
MKTNQSRNFLRCLSLLLVLCCTSKTVLCGGGFKSKAYQRMAHNFGKRTFEDTYDTAPSIPKTGIRNWITLKDLIRLKAYDSELAYRAAHELDTNGDGLITVDELVGIPRERYDK